MGIVLRILTLATFFIGLGLFTGTIGGDLWRWLHLLIGLGIVVLAVVVLGPWVREATTAGVMRRLAWWSPLVALALGLVLFGERLGLWSIGTDRSTVITVHVIVGIVVVGLLEIALGQMRRAAHAAEQRQDDTSDTPA